MDVCTFKPFRFALLAVRLEITTSPPSAGVIPVAFSMAIMFRSALYVCAQSAVPALMTVLSIPAPFNTIGFVIVNWDGNS